MPDFIARPLAAAQAVGRIPPEAAMCGRAERNRGVTCASAESSSNMVNKPLTGGLRRETSGNEP